MKNIKKVAQRRGADNIRIAIPVDKLSDNAMAYLCRLAEESDTTVDKCTKEILEKGITKLFSYPKGVTHHNRTKRGVK